MPWAGPEHAVTSDDPIDASAPASEKLGRLQFNISYDFEVRCKPVLLFAVRGERERERGEVQYV
jgi:hypothetical protein